MISGLKFYMPADELRAHLQTRIDHHKEREAFYAQQAESLTAGHAEGTNYSGGDPIRALTDKKREHGERVKLFTFMRDHASPNEAYELGDADLTRIEILGRGW